MAKSYSSFPQTINLLECSPITRYS